MAEGLRERKKQRTRQRLEQAALALFEERGYGETSIEEIADAAEVSASTFFRYFGTKHEVLFWRQPEYLAGLLAAVRRRPRPSADLVSLGEALVEFAEVLDGHGERVLSLLRLVEATPELQSRQLQLRSQWQEAVATQLADEAGLPAADLRARTVAAALLAVFSVAMTAWCEEGGHEPLRAVTRRTVDQLPDLLVPDSWRPRRGVRDAAPPA